MKTISRRQFPNRSNSSSFWQQGRFFSPPSSLPFFRSLNETIQRTPNHPQNGSVNTTNSGKAQSSNSGTLHSTPTKKDLDEIEALRRRWEEERKRHKKAIERSKINHTLLLKQQQLVEAESRLKEIELKYSKQLSVFHKVKHGGASEEKLEELKLDLKNLRFELDEAKYDVENAKEHVRRAQVGRKSTNALKNANVSTRTYVDKNTARLIGRALRQSNLLRPYLSTKQSIDDGQFHIMNSDAEFNKKYRDLHPTVRLGTEAWENRKKVKGFYHRKSNAIYLRPRATHGAALHEAIHKYSSRSFRAIFGSDLDEGMTQYFTDKVLSEHGLQKGRTLYNKQLACAKKLVQLEGFQSVAEMYFDGNPALKTSLDEKLRADSIEPQTFLYKSEKWCNWLSKR